MSKKYEDVVLALPKPLIDFYTALAESEKKPIEIVLQEELIADAEMIVENQETRMTALIKHHFGLEKILDGKEDE